MYSSAVADHGDKTTPAPLATHAVQRSIGGDVTSLLEITLLRNDSGDTTCTQASSTSTDQLGEGSEELPLFEGGLDTKEMGEDSDDSEEFVGGVAINRSRTCDQ